MNITQLIAHLDQACGAATDKKAYLEASVAVELAFTFQIPSQPVDSIVAYFEQMHADIARRVIGDVNEMYPLNVQTCYNLCVDYYKARYTLVHAPRLLSSQDIARYLSRDAVEVSVSDKHYEAIGNQYFGAARGTIADFITRYVAPGQSA